MKGNGFITGQVVDSSGGFSLGSNGRIRQSMAAGPRRTP